jgi:DNA-binding MarR family transcriptional regulator
VAHDVKEIELIDLMRAITKAIVARLAPLVSEQGLTVPEVTVLWKVHNAGSFRATALAEHLGLPPSTLTGLLDRLTERGLLDRGADPEDRRAVVMKSTDRLRDLMRQLMRAGSRQLERALRPLPPDVMPRLAADLSAVLACLEAKETRE